VRVQKINNLSSVWVKQRIPKQFLMEKDLTEREEVIKTSYCIAIQSLRRLHCNEMLDCGHRQSLSSKKHRV